MGRIRSIKPEFFRHEELYQAEKKSGLPLRVAFAGLWTVADREGRFKWRPTQIKLDVLPFDKVDMEEVLGVLTQDNFIVKYSVDGKEYGCIPSFKEHQVINIREAKSHIPPPDGVAMTIPQKRTHVPVETRRVVFERDQYKCVRCGAEESITIDHIFPVSCGGTHALTNLRTLCQSCNSARPVQGKALDTDLASDGLSWNDMERMCNTVHAHDGREGKGKEGKGREHTSVCVAIAGIFGRDWEEPQNRMPALANWYRTIEDQANKLCEVYEPEDATNQVKAYLKFCEDTKRKLIGTPVKVAETILQSDWITLNNPMPLPRGSPFAEAEYNKTLWGEEAWHEYYHRQIQNNPDFRKHFQITLT